MVDITELRIGDTVIATDGRPGTVFALERATVVEPYAFWVFCGSSSGGWTTRVFRDGRSTNGSTYPGIASAGPQAQEEIDPTPHPLPYFDLVAHLRGQIGFSRRTFGPGQRTAGVTAHIAKELDEIRANPNDLGEWVDVILLALDGAWRTGASPEEIAGAISTKQRKNESRQWPDWREMPADGAIEHVRETPP